VAGGSYLSSQDPRIVIGLGNTTKLDWIEIDRPADKSRSQRIENPAIDRYHSAR
jgi:hypothetical protein